MSMARSTVLCVALLSGWIFCSPWVVSIDANTAVSFQVTGAVALMLVLVAMMRADDLAFYGFVLVGVWLFVSPWLIGSDELPTRQSILYGVVIGGLAWFGRPSYKAKAAA